MRFILLAIILSVCFDSYGQIDTFSNLNSSIGIGALLQMDSLTDNKQASVATYLRLPIRETPNVLSVLTEEDIEESGARDLRELLMLLPGIDFETDAQNISGMGIRGLWGAEGKVLVLWDGNVMNETAYGSFSFNQHIFLGNIKRVEVIRGPGSAIYGGMAGLAVINITSKDYADPFTSGYVCQSFGISRNRLSNQVWQIGLGKKWANGFSINASGTFSDANLSNQLVGDTVNYADSSAISTRQFSLQGKYKNLDFSLLYDGHKVDVVEGVGRTVFSGWYGQLNYQYKISEKLLLVPSLHFKIQEPWNFEYIVGEDMNTINHRYTASVRIQYEPNIRLNFVGGTEYFYDDAVYVDSKKFFNDGQKNIVFSNVALFGQSIYKNSFANFTLGARYDNNNQFGSAFVPRVGVTKVLNRWHFKASYSKAFKAPNIFSLVAYSEIKPEKLLSIESEIGYQTLGGIALAGNVFFNQIKNPIVYSSLDGETDNYINGDIIKTAGVEVTSSLNKNWGKVNINYSYYHTIENRVPNFEIPNNSSMLLGLPQHKIVGSSFFNLYKNLSGSLTGIFQTSKTYLNFSDQAVSKPANIQINLSIKQSEFFYPGLSVEAGVYNLLDQPLWFVPPYNIDVHPVPQMGREFRIKLVYRISH